jgi:transglutaminase-like putative cysteine protease
LPAEGPVYGAAKKIRSKVWLSVLLTMGAIGPTLAASRYDVVPAPQWVEPAELPTAPFEESDKDKGGVRYVLVDHQIRVDGTRAEYARFVTRLNNVTGVEDNSQITIDFDPKLEKLHLHTVLVRRGAEALDQLRIGRIRVLQRESELEDNVLDGDLTFHILLSDVRVGDTIDYSYTIERRDPDWGNRAYGRYSMQWSVPVVLARVRVSAPLGAPMSTRSHGNDAPKRWVAAQWQYWEWSKPNPPVLRKEKNAPGWLEQYSSVEFSQFADWSELARSANALFTLSAKPSNDLLAISKRLESGGATPEQRAIAVLKFVQEEIRYTGIEEGRGAFKPTPPNEVLTRRYGDCKDKTLLAVTLLRSVGIDAAPALVSTHWRQKLGERLPSPGLMNHAVVRAQIAGKRYWFDVTATGQGGQLPHFTQAHFGAALVVAPGVTQLEEMPDVTAVTPLTVSRSTFDLRAGLQAEAVLTISTKYLGVEADNKRRQLRSSGVADLGKQYLEYYKGRYPGTRSAKPLRLTDDLDLNEITIDESYRIDHIFKTNKKGAKVLYLIADTIVGSLEAPDPPERTTPLAIDFPTHDMAKITVLLPSSWNITEGVEKIQEPGFEYGSNISYRNDEVTLEYRYRALADNVAVNQLAQYIKQLERAKDDVYFNLSYEPDSIRTANRTSAFTGLKIILLLGGAYLAFQLLRYALVVRELLTMAIQRVEVSPCAIEHIPSGESQLLMMLDESLVDSGFRPIGFLAHDPFTTKHDKAEHVRVLGHATLPIQAFVSRRAAPEYGSYVNLWFETPLVGGRILHTANYRASEHLSDPKILTECLSAVSASEVLIRHQKRLEARTADEIRPVSFSLSGDATDVTAAFASIRNRLRDKGWLVPTSDPLLDRITLSGAIRLAQSSIRLYGAGSKASGPSETREDQMRRAEADYLAIWHLSKSPKEAPGVPWALLMLNSGWALAILLGVAVVLDLRTALLALAAVTVHEAGHAMAVRANGKLAAPLFFLPFFGAMRIDTAVAPRLQERTTILLAGPLPGLILAAVLLGCNTLWPHDLLVAAARVFMFINGVMLAPFSLFDGARLLEGMTRPDALSRLIVQLVSVAAMIFMGIELESPGLLGIGVVSVFLLPGRFRAYGLARAVTAQVSTTANWEEVTRKALLVMTFPHRIHWQGARRRVWAAGLADQFSVAAASRQDRLLAIAGYGVSVALAIVLACAAPR